MTKATPFLTSAWNFQSNGSSRTMKLQETEYHNKYGRRAFSHVGPKLWNLLPKDIRDVADTDKFKKDLKSFLLLRGEEFCAWANRQWHWWYADTPPYPPPNSYVLEFPHLPWLPTPPQPPKFQCYTPNLFAKISCWNGCASGGFWRRWIDIGRVNGGYWCTTEEYNELVSDCAF